MEHLENHPIDYFECSSDSIVEACQSGKYPILNCSNCLSTGRFVMQIAPNAVVKHGPGVTAAEAATQAFVHARAHPSLFCVPEVFRFFERPGGERGSIGYLVMEFVSGARVSDLDDTAKAALAPRLYDCLMHLWQLPVPHGYAQPGPINGGDLKGLIWCDITDLCIWRGPSLIRPPGWRNTIGPEIDVGGIGGGYEGGGGPRPAAFGGFPELQDWFNITLDVDEILARRGRWDVLGYPASLEIITERLDVYRSGLAMVHGDFVARNLVLQPDGTIYLLDWSCAGLYPFWLDIYTMICNEIADKPFLTPLLNELKYYIGSFRNELNLLTRVQRTNAAIRALVEPIPYIPGRFTVDPGKKPPLDPEWPEEALQECTTEGSNSIG